MLQVIFLGAPEYPLLMCQNALYFLKKSNTYILI